MRIAVVCDKALDDRFLAAAAAFSHAVRMFRNLERPEDLGAFSPDALVLQYGGAASALQDGLTALYQEGMAPLLLLWERTADGSCVYAESVGADLGGFLAAALGEVPMRLTYPEGNWCLRFPAFSQDLLRRETMKTILYGMTGEEFHRIRRAYGLRLGSAGFYLFVWELDKAALMDYPVHKSIHYLLHMLRLEEFSRILREFADGEIIFSDISFAYILLNAPRCNSIAAHRQQAEAVTRALSAAGGRRSAYCFVSGYLDDCAGILPAYREFQRTCAYRFFCREAQVLSEAYIQAHQRWVQPSVIQEALEEIRRDIRFDVDEETLCGAIRRLYLDIIKPSMSYKLYYIASEGILDSLKEELALQPALDAIDDPWLALAAQFSSIEESCERLLSCIADMNGQQVKKHAIRSTLVRRAVQYIEQNYARQLPVTEIADKLGITASHLSQRFKRETGISVKRYLTNCRVQAAKQLLLTTDDPVSWVATAVGYGDFRQFSKMFKATTGVLPTQYRKGDMGKSQITFPREHFSLEM